MGRGHPHSAISGLHTWCRAGRLPPRLCHVTWAWAWPGTTHFRSRVCPSATWEDDDSILMGMAPPGTAGTETASWGFGQGQVQEQLGWWEPQL